MVNRHFQKLFLRVRVRDGLLFGILKYERVSVCGTKTCSQRDEPFFKLVYILSLLSGACMTQFLLKKCPELGSVIMLRGKLCIEVKQVVREPTRSAITRVFRWGGGLFRLRWISWDLHKAFLHKSVHVFFASFYSGPFVTHWKHGYGRAGPQGCFSSHLSTINTQIQPLLGGNLIVYDG